MERESKLIIAHHQEPAALIPSLNPVASTIYISNLLFSYFTIYNDRMEAQPDILTEIPTVANGDISKNYRQYRFRLRDDVYFHDGKQLTVKDVVCTYRLIMNPAVNVVSRAGYDIIERIETPDSLTVIFHLKETLPDFELTVFNGDPILPAHYFPNPGAESIAFTDFFKQPIGSGPYRFEEWISGSHISFTRHAQYFRGRPGLDGLTIKFIPSAGTMLLQLQTGEIMGYSNAEVAHLSQLNTLPHIRVYQTPMLTYEHIDFNLDHPILKERAVRQAIAKFINREELIEKIYRNVGAVAYSDVHPMSPYYNPAVEQTGRWDPEGARKLLSDNGWIDRDDDGIRDKNGQSLVLNISTTAGRTQREEIEQVLQYQLRDLGIQINIRNYHPSVFFGPYEQQGILQSGKFDLALFAWSVPPSPLGKSIFYSEHHLPPNGQNVCRIRNARLTDLLEQGNRSFLFDDRKRIYDEVSLILAQEVPVIPVLWRTKIDPYIDSLQNFRPNPTNSGDSWNAWEWTLSQ
jgi:peptide/nickel transport system substrate-binding protein